MITSKSGIRMLQTEALLNERLKPKMLQCSLGEAVSAFRYRDRLIKVQ